MDRVCRIPWIRNLGNKPRTNEFGFVEVALIPLHKVRMEPSVAHEIKKVLYSGFVGQGNQVERFEQALKPWIESENILTVNSCTSALTLALRLSGVKAGDEVISTPVTCTATNTPILNAGAKIAWADVNPYTGLIDAESVKKKITKKTKAVVAVHYAGLACDLAALKDVVKDSGLKIILDAAHALGTHHRGILDPVAKADFACFSFQAIKPLTTIDGGLLVCKSRKDYDRAKLLRWYGIKRPVNLSLDIKEAGYKFHMNDVAATIGLENLKGLALDLRRRRENAEFFSNRIPGCVYEPESSNYLFLLLVDSRDSFIKHMKARGIAVGTVHERNDQYSMFRDSRCPLPGVDAFCARQVAIPVGPWVTPKDRTRIVRAVLTYINN